jgi:hypothetical protein
VSKLARSLSLAVALAGFSGPSFCADAGPLTISVPPGFEGPTHEEVNGGVTLAWIERQPAYGGATLLQVSAIDVGSSLDGITRAQRLEGATRYLLQFVHGVAESLSSSNLASSNMYCSPDCRPREFDGRQPPLPAVQRLDSSIAYWSATPSSVCRREIRGLRSPPRCIPR